MIFLIRVSSRSLEAGIGDVVQSGDILGKNTRTMEQIKSPVDGRVTDILVGSNRQSVLVIESGALRKVKKSHGQNKRELVPAHL